MRLKQEYIVLENKHFRYIITSNGFNKSFVNKISGKDYIKEIGPFMEVVKDGSRYPSSAVNMSEDKLTIFFDPLKTVITLKVRLLDDYMTFELLSTGDIMPDEITLANLNLSFHENIGRILNVGFDEEFAVCVLALNLQTRSYGASESHAHLMAKCYSRYGIVGSKIAILGSPSNMIKEIIRKVQLNEGLPSPTLGGMWDKISQEVKKSYLFVTLSEQNVDDAIRYAKEGGFGYILDIWATQNYGHYTLDPKRYPSGVEGQKKIVRKIHDAGLKAGLHILTTCISKNDPYVTPIPDRRLAKDGSFILADDIDETNSFIPTKEPPTGVPLEEEKVYYIGGGLDIQIDDEIITYSGVSLEPPYGFTGCVRGARGTKPAKHQKSTIIHHLAQMFGCYIVDANTSLLDEVTQRIANIVNECGYDMIYLDGAEAATLQGAWWYYIPKVELAFFEKFKREVLIQGASYTVSIYKGQGSNLKVSDEMIDHFNWHIYSRDAQTDFVARGVKGHVDKVKLKGVADTLKNLMPAEFGWFGLLMRTPSFQATQPDEIEYVCNKCVGYDSVLSLETSVEALRENGWTPEILSIIKNYEMLRLHNYFTEDQKKKLRQPGAEFRSKKSKGRWSLRPVKYFEKYIMDIDGVNNRWSIDNEFKYSSFELKIRSLPSMANYDEIENIILIDFEDESSTGHQSAGVGISCKMESTSEMVKVGHLSGKLTATSYRDDDLGWCEFEKHVSFDLSKNRGLGFWIYGDGKGEILNIQLRSGKRGIKWYCDHYVVVDFEGWKYQEIPEPEGDRIFEYFRYTKDYYTLAARGFDYSNVISVVLRIMKIPPHTTVNLYLSNVKALREKPLPLRNPSITLEGKEIRFPVDLLPDQCLLYKSEEGICQLRSENGLLLKEVEVQGGTIMLKPGINDIMFNCDSSAGLAKNAKVRLAVLGEE